MHCVRRIRAQVVGSRGPKLYYSSIKKGRSSVLVTGGGGFFLREASVPCSPALSAIFLVKMRTGPYKAKCRGIREQGYRRGIFYIARSRSSMHCGQVYWIIATVSGNCLQNVMDRSSPEIGPLGVTHDPV